jgi:hypothetical protein
MAGNNQYKRSEPPLLQPHRSVGLIVEPMEEPTEEILEFRLTLSSISEGVNHSLENYEARMAELRRFVYYDSLKFILMLIFASQKSFMRILGQSINQIPLQLQDRLRYIDRFLAKHQESFGAYQDEHFPYHKIPRRLIKTRQALNPSQKWMEKAVHGAYNKSIELNTPYISCSNSDTGKFPGKKSLPSAKKGVIGRANPETLG